jgi:hypothetical protein
VEGSVDHGLGGGWRIRTQFAAAVASAGRGSRAPFDLERLSGSGEGVWSHRILVDDSQGVPRIYGWNVIEKSAMDGSLTAAAAEMDR